MSKSKSKWSVTHTNPSHAVVTNGNRMWYCKCETRQEAAAVAGAMARKLNLAEGKGK